MYTYRRSVVGGTFDHFHAGHQQLLTKAFAHSEQVIIGLSTAELHRHKRFSTLIQSYEERKKALVSFLTKNGFIKRAQIVPISDFYGTTLTDKHLEAIFVTEANISNVEQMNAERTKRGFHMLEAIVMPYIRGSDGEIITAERIRGGIVTREGHSYPALFKQKQQYLLPEALRETMSQPIGSIFNAMEDVVVKCKNAMITIAVGDIVARSLYNSDQQADISIIDHKTRRHKLPISLGAKLDHLPGVRLWKAENLAGMIEQQAVESLHDAISVFLDTGKRHVINITGEEDLLAIPAILLAPLASVVIYGQFEKGIVVVDVTEEKKEEVVALLKKFR